MITADNVAVVIVVFKLNLEDSPAFSSIKTIAENDSDQIYSLIIYDNSPNPQNYESSGNFQITYIHDENNSGISKAYNTAAKVATSLGKKWLLFLDHDTELNIDTIKKYLSSVNNSLEPQIKVPKLRLHSGKLFSPSVFMFNRGFIQKDLDAGIYSFKEFFFANSGMFISLELFLKAGGYNENVRLDHSDTEFIKRVRKLEPHFELLDFELKHDFSNDVIDKEKAIFRFKLYLKDTSNCVRENWTDSISYFMVCLLRSFILSYRYKDFIFIKTFRKEYL